jgi:octaprenyl-diphosphate synthase
MREIETAGDITLSEEDYFRIVRDKTAALMETCCKLGTLYSGASLGNKRRLIRFGEAYGVAFQILDDLLDIYATEEETRKSVGTDVQQGRVTLPMILALKNGGPRKAELEKKIKARDGAGLRPLLREMGAGEGVKERLDFWVRRAQSQLEVFGEDPAARVLASLAGDLRRQAEALTRRSA